MEAWLDWLALSVPALARGRAIPRAERGRALLDAGHHAEALGVFLRAVALGRVAFPHDPQRLLLSLSGEAAALALLGRPEDAEAAIREQVAITARPEASALDRSEVTKNLAAWCDATGRVDEEERVWAAIAAAPDTSPAEADAARLRRAICLRWLDRLDASEALADHLPPSDDASLLRARLAAERGRYDDAAARYAAIAEAAAHPALRAIASSRRFAVLSAAGRSAEAAAALAVAEASAGDHPSARAQILVDRATAAPAEAVALLRAALALPRPLAGAVLHLDLQVRLALALPAAATERAELADRVATRMGPTHSWVRALRP